MTTKEFFAVAGATQAADIAAIVADDVNYTKQDRLEKVLSKSSDFETFWLTVIDIARTMKDYNVEDEATNELINITMLELKARKELKK